MALSTLGQARVLIVTGKGGSGKTTVSAVLANLAARTGTEAQLVQIMPPAGHRDERGLGTPSQGAGPAWHLPMLFGSGLPLSYEPGLLRSSASGADVVGRALAADTALVEYFNQHGMKRLSKRLVASGALEVVATAVPGMPDMLVLGKVKQLERAAATSGQARRIVLDAPASGHAVRFLGGPRAIVEAAAGGPIRSQAQEVVEMLADPSRAQVVLVTTAEETPVSETVETARLLRDRAGITVAAVVVNSRLPELVLGTPLEGRELARVAKAAGAPLTEGQVGALLAAGELRRQRQASQAAQVERLAEELAVPQLELPFCFSPELGPEQLDTLTDAMERSLAKVAAVGGDIVGA